MSWDTQHCAIAYTLDFRRTNAKINTPSAFKEMQKYTRLADAAAAQKEHQILLAREVHVEGARAFYLCENLQIYKGLYASNKKWRCTHEIISGNEARPIFDFDGPVTDTSAFIAHVEEILNNILSEHYNQEFLPEYVWLDSEKPTKLSLHLVIRNYICYDWKIEMRVLNNFLMRKIRYKDYVDSAIIRTNASMRMPLNAKLSAPNYPLKFKDKSHTLEDGLVKVYTPQVLEPLVIKDKMHLRRLRESSSRNKTYTLGNVKLTQDEISHAMAVFHKTYPDLVWVFKKSTVKGPFISLNRGYNKSSACPISGRTHKKENAYLRVSEYDIRFYCRKGAKYEDCAKHVVLHTFEKPSLEDNEKTLIKNMSTEENILCSVAYIQAYHSSHS